MTYFKILLLAIALFSFLRFTSLHLPLLLKNRKIKATIIRVFPSFELFVWLWFIIWSCSIIFLNFAAFPVIMAFIVVIIMGILAWYLLRDIVSGLILCSENGFEPGQVIKTPFIQGTIKKLGYRSIEIISSNGEQVKVPYTMLMNTTVIKPQDNSKWVENVINLEFTTVLDATYVKNLLKRRLMEMPWIVSEESIKLEIKVSDAHYQELDKSHELDKAQELDKSSTKYCADIHFYSITPETAIKAKENLEEFIKKSIE